MKWYLRDDLPARIAARRARDTGQQAALMPAPLTVWRWYCGMASITKEICSQAAMSVACVPRRALTRVFVARPI